MHFEIEVVNMVLDTFTALWKSKWSLFPLKKSGAEQYISCTSLFRAG
jgi:hypothetical protein